MSVSVRGENIDIMRQKIRSGWGGSRRVPCVRAFATCVKCINALLCLFAKCPGGKLGLSFVAGNQSITPSTTGSS